MHPYLKEFLFFGIKQACACLFGGALLFLMIVTHFLWHGDWPLARYDFLFLAALALQAGLILTRLESFSEAKVILIFHAVGTAMEVFKTSVGSWAYPGPSLFHIGGVPLFSGFMYACVGSYIARIWRIFDFRFTGYPPIRATWLLCLAIYANFFTHHYLPDVRIALFAAAFWLFRRTKVYFTPYREERSMPLLLGFFLVALFIWLAENIGTYCGAWTYPHQAVWHPVHPAKLGAWWLLMMISFVLVSLTHSPPSRGQATRHPPEGH